MTKLNTFHWHITDSQSFPLILKSHPDLSRLGAYNAEKVYTAENIADVSAKYKVLSLDRCESNAFIFRSTVMPWPVVSLCCPSLMRLLMSARDGKRRVWSAALTTSLGRTIASSRHVAN